MLRLIFTFLLIGCTASTPVKKEESYFTYIDKSYVEKLDFSKQEPIPIKIGDEWFYVRKDGKAMPVMKNDKGEADRFTEGLARIKVNGKIGFFNRALDIVLKPVYDFAFPFHDGTSEICLGCQEVEYQGTTMLDGGKWKRIDRRGLILEEE